jgi:hypothetical protein
LIQFFVLQYLNAAFLNNLGSNFLNNIVSISPIFCYGKVIIRTGLRFHFAQLFTEIEIKLFNKKKMINTENNKTQNEVPSRRYNKIK